jgi:predicted metal-dependent phosphoesterase TrpH
MTRVSILFHVHTTASFDSILPVNYIFKFCQKNRIDVLAITDHNSLNNFAKTKTLGRQMGISVIPAVEFATNAGDIIGIFIKHCGTSRDCKEVLHSIKRQGGLSILAHPFKSHRLRQIPMDLIDLVEVFNARCNDDQNEAANYLSETFNKPQIVGADAHFPWELGLALNYLQVPSSLPITELNQKELIKALLGNQRKFRCHQSAVLNIEISQLIKALKTKNTSQVVNAMKGVLSSVMKR